MARKRRKMTPAEAGRLGGLATRRKHGVEHFRRLGKAGFQALARKLGYMGGSRLGAIQWLQRKGKLPGLSPAQHAELDGMVDGLFHQLLPPDEEDENPVVAAILRSIRSAPTHPLLLETPA